MRIPSLIVSAFCAALLACGGMPSDRGGEVDAPGNGGGDGDGSIGASELPPWMLEDIQPASPRVGQTYGLDAFTDQIIVVSLLEGF
jgi:hypothetical protein